MRLGRQRLHDSGQIHALTIGLLVEGEVQLDVRILVVAKQRVQEGSVATGAGGVIQFPRTAQLLRSCNHAHHGGNAYASGDKHIQRCLLVEWEIVAWCAYCQCVASAQHFMHVSRPTPALRVLVDAYQIAMALIRRIQQRITADQPVGQVQVDMGASREGGQFLQGRHWHQLEAQDAIRFVCSGPDADLKGVGIHKVSFDNRYCSEIERIHGLDLHAGGGLMGLLYPLGLASMEDEVLEQPVPLGMTLVVLQWQTVHEKVA